MNRAMHDMNENFMKEVEIIKNNKIEILEMKTSIGEIKIWLRVYKAEYIKEERISYLAKTLEVAQSHKNREKII